MDQVVSSSPLTRARAIAPMIAAASDAIERERCIPSDLLGELHAARLFRLLLPRSVGGDEVEPGDYLLAIEEIGRHDGSVAWCLFQSNSTALIAAHIDPSSARAIFADPHASVAWGPPNGTHAAAVPGGYRVSGRWRFASGCLHATWMGAHCLIDEPDGTVRRNASGRPMLRTLLFPANVVRVIDDWDVIGLRGTASHSYSVTDLFVPESYSGTRSEPEARRETGRLYAFTMQALYTVGSAGVALGLARAMLDAFVELAQCKTPGGLTARLADNAAVQSAVAQTEAKLDAARAFLLDTLARVWDSAGEVGAIDVAHRARVRLAATHAIQAAIETGDFAYRAAGSSAIQVGSPFERRFRDLHTLSQQTQARLANFESIGQVLLGVGSDEPFF